MVALLCYWWVLLWNVNIDKAVFACLSTIEMAFELFFLIPLCVVGILAFISERMKKDD